MKEKMKECNDLLFNLNAIEYKEEILKVRLINVIVVCTHKLILNLMSATCSRKRWDMSNKRLWKLWNAQENSCLEHSTGKRG